MVTPPHPLSYGEPGRHEQRTEILGMALSWAWHEHYAQNWICTSQRWRLTSSTSIPALPFSTSCAGSRTPLVSMSSKVTSKEAATSRLTRNTRSATANYSCHDYTRSRSQRHRWKRCHRQTQVILSSDNVVFSAPCIGSADFPTSGARGSRSQDDGSGFELLGSCRGHKHSRHGPVFWPGV